MSNSIKLVVFLVPFVSASVLLHEGTIHGGENHVGEHSAPKTYEFGYKISDPHGSGHFHKESGSSHGPHNSKIGSYGLQDADGRWRVVNYIADDHGFRASIETNEPGTGNSDPASVVVNGPDSHGAPPLTVASGGGHEHGHPSYGHGHGHGTPLEHPGGYHQPHGHQQEVYHGDGHGHGHGYGHRHQPEHGLGVIPEGVPLGPPVIGIPLIDNFKSSSSSSSSRKAESKKKEIVYLKKSSKVIHSSSSNPEGVASALVQSRDVSSPTKLSGRKDRQE